MDKEKRKEIDDKIIKFCKEYMTEHGYPPSYREIGNACEIKSTSTVNEYVMRLKIEGRIGTEAPFRSSRAFRLKGSKYVFEEEANENKQ